MGSGEIVLGTTRGSGNKHSVSTEAAPIPARSLGIVDTFILPGLRRLCRSGSPWPFLHAAQLACHLVLFCFSAGRLQTIRSGLNEYVNPADFSNPTAVRLGSALVPGLMMTPVSSVLGTYHLAFRVDVPGDNLSETAAAAIGKLAARACFLPARPTNCSVIVDAPFLLPCT